MDKQVCHSYIRPLEGDCWPTRQQELLLRASLLQGKKAIDSWYEWKSNVDLDQLDPGSSRLIPLLYKNLHLHKVNDSLVARFRAAYRLTWYKNQLLFHNVATLLRSFQSAGIQTMILKGAALISLYYKDYGLRPMGDYDILIHTEQIGEAIDLISELGWKNKSKSPNAFTNKYISSRHAYELSDAAGMKLDLHWYAFPECCSLNMDREFWNSAVVTQICNVKTCTMNPTDQLLHICVHGVEWKPEASLYWIADAMKILNTSQLEIDWTRLIKIAHKLRLILPLRYALTYLRNALDAPIPLATLTTIEEIPVSKIERMEYRIRTCRPKSLWLALAKMSLYQMRISGLANNTGRYNQMIAFISSLLHTWGPRRICKLMSYAFIKFIRRLFTEKKTSKSS